MGIFEFYVWTLHIMHTFDAPAATTNDLVSLQIST